MPYLVLMPVFAQTVLMSGAKGYGILMSCTGIGALAGALTLASLGNFRHRGRLILASSIIFVFFLDMFALSRNFALSSAVLTVIGFTMVMQAATTNSLLQTMSPDNLRGRVMAVFSTMFVGFAPIGSFQAGLIAQHFGAPIALIVGSAAMTLCIVLVLLLRPQVRTL